MISIAGIKYQKELEELPYFNKFAAGQLIGKKDKNLDKKISQLIKKKYLLPFKKGFYVTSVFVEKIKQKQYQEYIANMLRFPSYLSLEYVLGECGLIPEGIYSLTSVTIKSSRVFRNFLGNFIYRNIKEDLFCGYEEKEFGEKKIKFASRAKALFDFLYLKKMVDIKKELLEDLRINWDNFNENDFQEFADYVKKSGSLKMETVLSYLSLK